MEDLIALFEEYDTQNLPEPTPEIKLPSWALLGSL